MRVKAAFDLYSLILTEQLFRAHSTAFNSGLDSQLTINNIDKCRILHSGIINKIIIDTFLVVVKFALPTSCQIHGLTSTLIHFWNVTYARINNIIGKASSRTGFRFKCFASRNITVLQHAYLLITLSGFANTPPNGYLHFPSILPRTFDGSHKS